MAPVSSQTVDVFISYSRADEAAVGALTSALAERGIKTFLDRNDLTAGMPWPQALEQGLQAARSVLVAIGRDGLGPWQKRELWFALDRQVDAERSGAAFPVIPVLLAGADPAHGFLSLNTWVDCRRSGLTTDGLDAIVRAIRGTETPVPAASGGRVCPFRSLQSFREEDAGFYFGRETIASKLLEKIHAETSSSGVKLFAVVGPSGSGKSSLALAGLLPLLRRQRPPKLVWDAIVFTPRERPWRALAEALLALLSPKLSETERIQEAGPLAEELARGDGALESAVRRSLLKQQGTDRLLLIVDQFEELFTLSNVDRHRFVEVLLESTRTSPVTVLLTLRADFYGLAVGCHRSLSDALETGQVNLGPLNREELARVIEQPARRVGLRFESGLPERIIADVEAQPGSLPLLEYALAALWERRNEGVLSHVSYLEMGGISGAIATTAENVFTALTTDLQEAARRVFQRMVRPATIGEGGADTRRRVRLSEIGGDDWRVVERFAAPTARLVVIARDHETGEQSAELAHESTVQAWSRLRGWIDDDRKFLLWRQWLAHALAEWSFAGEVDDLLLRGERLRDAARWLIERPRDVNQHERRFILAGTTDEFHIRQLMLAGNALVPFANQNSGTRWILALLAATEREQALLAVGEISDPNAAATAAVAAARACWHAGFLDDAGELAQRALVSIGRSTYGQLTEPVLPILVKTGNLDDTLAFVRAFALPEQRSGLLVRVADLLAVAKSQEEASALRQEAFGIAEQALAAAVLSGKEGAQLAAALAYTHAGFVQDALSVMRSQQQDWPLVWEGAIDVLARQGRVAEAISIAEAAESEARVKLYRQLVRKLADEANPHLLDAIRLIPPGSDSYEISEAAGKLARAGLLKEAEQAIEFVTEDYRVGTRREIAMALARAGRSGEAVQQCEAVRDSDKKAWLLGLVARALVDSNYSDAAMGVVRSALRAVDASGVYESTRSSVMSDVAYVFATAGGPSDALIAIERIGMKDRRAAAFAEVADVLARRGHRDESRTAAQMAITTAHEFGRSEVRYMGRDMAAAARALARAGFVDDALTTAGALLTSGDQGTLMVRIGLICVEAGNATGGALALDRALLLVDQSSGDTTRAARILPAAAILAASLGRYEYARQLVERCAPTGRLESYAAVLREYGRRTHPERRDFGEAQWEAARNPGESW
jgi:hypothetical protein